jgi:hypothetical protein
VGSAEGCEQEATASLQRRVNVAKDAQVAVDGIVIGAQQTEGAFTQTERGVEDARKSEVGAAFWI